MKRAAAGILGLLLLIVASGARGDEPLRAVAGDQVQAYGILTYDVAFAGNTGIEIRLLGADDGEVGRLITDPFYLHSTIQFMDSPVVELSFSRDSFTVRADARDQGSLTALQDRTLVSQFSNDFDQIRGVLELSSKVLSDSSLKELVALASQQSRPQGAIDCIFSCIACMLFDGSDAPEDGYDPCLACGECLNPEPQDP